MYQSFCDFADILNVQEAWTKLQLREHTPGVSFAEKYDGSVSFLRQRLYPPRCRNDPLIIFASSSRVPTASVFDTISIPARPSKYNVSGFQRVFGTSQKMNGVATWVALIQICCRYDTLVGPLNHIPHKSCGACGSHLHHIFDTETTSCEDRTLEVYTCNRTRCDCDFQSCISSTIGVQFDSLSLSYHEGSQRAHHHWIHKPWIRREKDC